MSIVMCIDATSTGPSKYMTFFVPQRVQYHHAEMVRESTGKYGTPPIGVQNTPRLTYTQRKRMVMLNKTSNMILFIVSPE